MAPEIRVERARCIGSRTCTYAAPGVFALDAANVAVVVDPAAASEQEVAAAAEACPTGAIIVGPVGPAV